MRTPTRCTRDPRYLPVLVALLGCLLAAPGRAAEAGDSAAPIVHHPAWPGGTDFNDRGTSAGMGSDFRNALELPTSRAALDLSIRPSQEEFWRFEPVELDIELKVRPGTAKKYQLPDTLDPVSLHS